MRSKNHDVSRSWIDPVAARYRKPLVRGILTTTLLILLLVTPDIATAYSTAPDNVQGCGHDDLQGPGVNTCLVGGGSILCIPDGGRYCCNNNADGSVDRRTCRTITTKTLPPKPKGPGSVGTPPKSSTPGKPQSPGSVGTPRPLSDPKTPTKPQGPGPVGTPPKSNPTTPVKPTGPGSVDSPPKSNSSSGGGGPILRSGNSGNSNSNNSGGSNSGGSKR